MKESASTAARTSATRKVSGLLACVFVVALGGCSADGAAEAEPATTPAAESPSPFVVAPESDLAEPLAPQIEFDGYSPSGQRVLSEQGVGTGTHEFDGVLEAGQVLSLSASCSPGDSVSISAGMGSYTVPCSSPGSSYSFNAPAAEPVEDVEVTVETADGSPYWLAAWVHDAE
ncbi:hypothetical protein MUG94_14730 [Arthrobacter gengyunqii]|uniref:Lipoprotein n=1 Tax=Arthrobacter gengyunqii TaxID=2886940 RepID=A0A9X1M096_9MICC|nr:hypothetical protein [Arthrobacter gengyunqii]MCC3268372.1 hypothetical protein [Arthrobacter gengyunqii]UOY95768.1 hypothetical protein MUG94_14730 [Arthrobacter gengyunqii]